MTQFKNVPNLKLKGTSFDARHLAKFIDQPGQEVELNSPDDEGVIISAGGEVRNSQPISPFIADPSQEPLIKDIGTEDQIAKPLNDPNRDIKTPATNSIAQITLSPVPMKKRHNFGINNNSKVHLAR